MTDRLKAWLDEQEMAWSYSVSVAPMVRALRAVVELCSEPDSPTAGCADAMLLKASVRRAIEKEVLDA